MTRPFCVKCHIGIYPNASFAFIRIDGRKKLITFGLLPLHMVTKNEFGCHKICIDVGLMTDFFLSPILWWSNLFNHQSYDDQKFFIPKLVTIKSFWLPIMWQSIFFQSPFVRWLKGFTLEFDHPIDNWLISTIELAIKFVVA